MLLIRVPWFSSTWLTKQAILDTLGFKRETTMCKHKLLPVFLSAGDLLAQSSHMIEPRVTEEEGYLGTWITGGKIHLELVT